MPSPPLSKIVAEIEKEKTAKKQAEVIRKHNNPSLKEILILTFHPTVEWKLPEGAPPYKPLAESTDMEGRLYGEVKKSDYFVNTPQGLQLSSTKRETMFIQLLESLDPGDARLLLRMKDKDLKIKKEALKEVFPEEGW